MIRFLARIGVMNALHRPEVRPFNPDAKEHQARPIKHTAPARER
jgi:hypothetical protein